MPKVHLFANSVAITRRDEETRYELVVYEQAPARWLLAWVYWHATTRTPQRVLRAADAVARRWHKRHCRDDCGTWTSPDGEKHRGCTRLQLGLLLDMDWYRRAESGRRDLLRLPLTPAQARRLGWRTGWETGEREETREKHDA